MKYSRDFSNIRQANNGSSVVKSLPADHFCNARNFYGITVAALLFVLLAATEVLELTDDIFALRLPSLFYIVPSFMVFWTPVLLLIIWFNGVTRGCGRFKFVVEWPMLAGAALLVTMAGLESVHALAREGIPDFELFYRFAWVLFLFVALRSFSYMEAGFTRTMLLLVAVCCSLLSVASIFFPIYSVGDLGLAGYFAVPLRPIWSGVNSHSYFAAVVVVISLHKMLYTKETKYSFVYWVATFLVNLTGIVFNKARGAWIAVLLAMLMMITVRLTGWKSRTIIIGGAILGLVATMCLILVPSPVLEEFISFGRGLSSAKLRLKMLFTTARLFLQSPILGIGWSHVTSFRVSGHAVHGVIQTISASYGIIGLVLLVSVVYFSLPNRSVFGGSPLVPAVILVTGAAAVALMTPPMWFAVVLSCLCSIGEMEVRK
jgi:hypothetical protein